MGSIAGARDQMCGVCCRKEGKAKKRSAYGFNRCSP